MPTEINYSDTHRLISSAVAQKSEGSALVTYLEIGVQEGHSLKAVMESSPVVFAIGVDTWGDNYGGTGRCTHHHVVELLGPLSSRVVLISGNSHSILSGIGHKFDVIFVDGDHSEAGALLDLEDSLALLKPDGILFFDDLDHPKHPYMHFVTEHFRARHDLTILNHAVGYGVSEFRRT